MFLSKVYMTTHLVHCAGSDHVGLGVWAATLQILYLIKNPVDVRSLLRI